MNEVERVLVNGMGGPYERGLEYKEGFQILRSNHLSHLVQVERMSWDEMGYVRDYVQNEKWWVKSLIWGLKA